MRPDWVLSTIALRMGAPGAGAPSIADVPVEPAAKTASIASIQLMMLLQEGSARAVAGAAPTVILVLGPGVPSAWSDPRTTPCLRRLRHRVIRAGHAPRGPIR